jgi:hypothetical protein
MNGPLQYAGENVGKKDFAIDRSNVFTAIGDGDVWFSAYYANDSITLIALLQLQGSLSAYCRMAFNSFAIKK